MKPKQTSEWEKEFDELSMEAFFTILGDERYIVGVVDHQGEHEEELDKSRLHDELKMVYKDFIQSLLTTAKQEWIRETVEKLEGLKTTRSYEINDGVMELNKDYGEFRRFDEGYNQAIQYAIKVVEENE